MSATELAAAITATAVPSAAALVAALIAVIGVRNQIRQKDAADRRAEWWHRFEKAVEWTASDHTRLAVSGYDALTTLVGSALASQEEALLAERVALARLDLGDDDGA